MSDSTKKEGMIKDGVKYVSAGLQYSIDGQEGKTVQFILHPNRIVTIDSEAVCWSSDDIELQSKSSFFSQVLGGANSLSDVSNNNVQKPVVFALSKTRGGKVCEINLDSKIAEKGLFISKECFLCATEDINVEPRAWTLSAGQYPLPMHTTYHIESIKGSLFLQSEGVVLKKTLQSGEKFIVDSLMLVAHAPSCTISISEKKSSFYAITGPGVVFMSAHTVSSRFVRTTALISPFAQRNNLGGSQLASFLSLVLKITLFAIISSLISVIVTIIYKMMTDKSFTDAVNELIEELNQGE